MPRIRSWGKGDEQQATGGGSGELGESGRGDVNCEGEMGIFLGEL